MLRVDGKSVAVNQYMVEQTSIGKCDATDDSSDIERSDTDNTGNDKNSECTYASIDAWDVERDVLFKNLESFFSSHTSDPSVVDHISIVYQVAKEANSLEAYETLLKWIYNSTIIFPDFVVEKIPQTKKSNNDKREFKVYFPIHRFNNENLPKDEQEGHFEIKTKGGKMNPNGMMNSQSEIENLRHDFKQKQQVQDDKIDICLNTIESFGNILFDRKMNLISPGNRAEMKLQPRGENFQEKEAEEEAVSLCNPQDSYGFIWIGAASFAGVLGYLTFVIQIISYLITVSDSYINRGDRFPFLEETFLPIPRGVSTTVHAGQIIAISLMALLTPALWESLSQFINTYDDDLRNQGVHFCPWLLANMLKLIESIISLVATFIIIVVSENNLSLFKDFTAVTFISSFDNILYEFASMNLLGKKLRNAVRKCESLNVRYHPGRSRRSHGLYGSVVSAIEKRMFRSPAGLIGILMVIIYTSYFYLSFIPQVTGQLLCQSLVMQASEYDTSLTYFSGQYTIERDGQYFFYKEDKKSATFENRQPHIIKYCPNHKAWVLTISNKIDTDV